MSSPTSEPPRAEGVQAAGEPAPGIRTISPGRFWFGVLAGPLGWALVLLAADIIVEYACVSRGPAMTRVLGLPLVSALVFLLAVIAGTVMLVAGVGAYHDWRDLRQLQARAPGARPGRAEFMALGGVLLSVLFLIAMIFQATTALLLPPCTMLRL